ncbi:cyclin-P3-1-like [Actinidia eriantha]|uniref:cyclin-P3-1-like n=1 Tax=Actinidia eriantha TaxID=165200 RepID=UPI002587DC7D|nr:cyclin-P3-1-like [Actinidia eriantha]
MRDMATKSVNDKALRSNSYSNLGLSEYKRGVSKSPQVLSLLASVLEKTIQKNERSIKASKRKEVITVFHGSKAPALSIRQYIERIFKYSSCSPSCFVVAYIYLDRFIQQRGAYLTSLNVHRLLITSVMLAAKFLDDEYYNNEHYARVGGVSTAEMNKLELDFLFSIDFKLFASVETFNSYCSSLEK